MENDSEKKAKSNSWTIARKISGPDRNYSI